MATFVDAADLQELLEYARKEEREVEYLEEHYRSLGNRHMEIYSRGQVKVFKYMGDAIQRVLLDAEEGTND